MNVKIFPFCNNPQVIVMDHMPNAFYGEHFQCGTSIKLFLKSQSLSFLEMAVSLRVIQENGNATLKTCKI